MGDGETIYKLVGPVLLKQDKIEAESTVKGRLDFIGAEVLVSQILGAGSDGLTGCCSSRLETQVTETQENLENKKAEIIQVQASAQGAGVGQGNQPTQ